MEVDIVNEDNVLRSRQRIISKLTEARLEKQMSQAELASLIGTQRSNICRIERGTQNLSLDMLIKISEALGKDVDMLLEERREPMNNCYSLRLYDDEILTFTLEEKGLEGLKSHIVTVNEDMKNLFPLDLDLTDDGILKWLERRVIPKNRAFVDEILKTLGLSLNNTKGIIDVCKGLSLNDSYWVVPADFNGTFKEFNLYENRFSEVLSLVAYTGVGTANPLPLRLNSQHKVCSVRRGGLLRTTVSIFTKAVRRALLIQAMNLIPNTMLAKSQKRWA